MEKSRSKNQTETDSLLFAFDDEMRISHGTVCGIDEAGRGPLAGDVFAVAVVLPVEFVIQGLNDSKKLSEKKREELFEIIKEKSLSFSIAVASVREIDELNILNATLLAMKRAVAGLSLIPDYALVDGNAKPELNIKLETIIKGDAKSASIAAASILAKVSRDRYMKKIAEEYPQYLFEKHKGYGTELHYKMLREHGASEIHRRSFLKKFFEKQNNND